jgi:hypothetical protein
MERNFASELREPALKQPKTLEWINCVHGALKWQVNIKSFQKLDRLLDNQLLFLKRKLVDGSQKIVKAFSAGEVFFLHFGRPRR